jgi:hypothetical protein
VRAGDIVIPGVFLALLLRYDALAALRRGQLLLPGSPARAVVPGAGAAVADTSLLAGASFPAPYFNTGLVAYTLGLVATLVVMLVWDAAQPALLYLVPAVLGASALTAAVRGELRALMVDYSDDAYVSEMVGGDSEDAAAAPAGGSSEGSGSGSASAGEPASSSASGGSAAEEESKSDEAAAQPAVRRRVRRRD